MDENNNSSFNIDSERLRSLNHYLVLCEDGFTSWNLEDIYTNLRAIRRVICGILIEPDLDQLDKTFEELEKQKRIIDKDRESDKNEEDSALSIKFYDLAEKIYAKLSRLMIMRKLFFTGDKPINPNFKR